MNGYVGTKVCYMELPEAVNAHYVLYKSLCIFCIFVIMK